MRKNITQYGMTLIEMIVVVSIFLVLMTVVTNSVTAIYRQNAYAFAQAHQLQNARVGVDALTRDLREMIYADNGSFPIDVMETHRISFYSDIDRDNSVEYVQYEMVDDTVLEKRVFNATGAPPVYNFASPDETMVISRYVQNYLEDRAIFRYYAADGTEIIGDDPTAVRYIGMELVINIDPIRDPGQYLLRSSAALRNIR